MSIITTRELEIRYWEPEDEQQFIQLIQQEHIQNWLPDWDEPESWIGEWIRNVNEHYKIDLPLTHFQSFAVVLRETGGLIGQISFGGDDFDGEKLSIAYFMDQNYLGRSFTTQAVTALTDYIFHKYDYADINGLVQAANIASNRVMEKAGFTRSGEVKKQLHGHPDEKLFIHWIRPRQ